MTQIKTDSGVGIGVGEGNASTMRRRPKRSYINN